MHPNINITKKRKYPVEKRQKVNITQNYIVVLVYILTFFLRFALIMNISKTN